MKNTMKMMSIRFLTALLALVLLQGSLLSGAAYAVSDLSKALTGSGFALNLADADYWEETEYHGEVNDVRYRTHWYSAHTAHDHVKYMTVYTPYGYNENEKYDVLVLIPGMDMTENCYLNKAHHYASGATGSVFLPNLFDNAIEQGLMKPMIVVNINYFGATVPGAPNLEQDCNHVVNELRYDVLPYIAENYSTYAENGSEASLQEAREHFGIFGFSYSATMVAKWVMPECLDICAWFGASSVFFTNTDAGISKINKQCEKYPLRYFYCGCGSNDDAKNQTQDMYQILLDGCPCLKRGENTDLVVLPDTGHDAKTYDTAIFNCVTTFFKEVP